jgi:hypothetical protein
VSDGNADALSELEDVFSETLTWINVEFPLCASSRKRGGKLEPGGFATDNDASFALRAELFDQIGAQPLKKELVTFNRYDVYGVVVETTRYQIDEVITLPGGEIIRLLCVSYGKGGG